VTFGANVKASTDSIGTFGTGLKYSIATVVRNGGELVIKSGPTVYTFALAPATIRGKHFDFITMTTTEPDGQSTAQTLAFTTELGKNWKPWMVYRELWSNCMDEGGKVDTSSIPHTADTTTITVRWAELFQAHANRRSFLISKSAEPLFATSRLQVFSHSDVPPGIYYRGILVTEGTGDLAVSKFSYNILSAQTLTEDRTLPLPQALEAIAYTVAKCQNPALITAVCDVHKAAPNAIEHNLPFDYWLPVASSEWKSTVAAMAKSRFLALSNRVKRTLATISPTLVHPTEVPLSQLPASYQLMWTKAQQAVTELGYEWPTIKFTEALPNLAMGVYFGATQTIFISFASFKAGTKQLAMTLLEECIHAQCGCPDLTRQFQEVLLHLAMDQYEQRKGVPL
jgi:hypothetical protein